MPHRIVITDQLETTYSKEIYTENELLTQKQLTIRLGQCEEISQLEVRDSKREVTFKKLKW